MAWAWPTPRRPAGRGHRRGGRRGPQSRRVVRTASAVCRHIQVPALGAALDVPVLASANLASILLAGASAVAVFRFKVGMVPVLLASSLAGVVYFLIVGGCLVVV